MNEKTEEHLKLPIPEIEDMVTEDYVSFETAKLLKEKGFDAECHSYYYPCHYPDGSIEYHRDKGAQSRTKIWYNVYSLKNLPKDHYLAPTLQMAMKWLRKIHNLEIYPYHNSPNNRHNSEWWFEIIKYPNSVAEYESGTGEEVDTYEEACEAAIKYCLENLI